MFLKGKEDNVVSGGCGKEFTPDMNRFFRHNPAVTPMAQTQTILASRGSGILLPVFSLPSAFGIGNVGPGAHDFLDFLHRGRQHYWQILPLGPTSQVFGHSPYMSFSSLAGNPLFISPELLIKDGLLDKMVPGQDPLSEYLVDYATVSTTMKKVLATAWQRFQQKKDCQDILTTFSRQQPWVEEHSLFLALKSTFRQSAWQCWPEEIRTRDTAALTQARTELTDEIRGETFHQYLFYTQWQALREHARQREIALIGDLPIYVALDSVDVWANQEIFDLEPATGLPRHVAGVPPDYFSKTGQLWGNPLYRWQSTDPAVKEQLYNWWEQRFRTLFSQVDLVRIDHFRGFADYWSVPADEKTAVNGTWLPGPGASFFQEMKKRLGALPCIAEDLGTITPAVDILRRELDFPGMRVLLFGFDGDAANVHLPQNYDRATVVYTGTHDNDTAVGWYLSPETPPEARKRAKQYANRDNDDGASFHRDMLYLALSSVADTAILPMQDVLGFGNDCRINVPGTTKNNWRWRCAQRFITDELADWLAGQTGLFNRVRQKRPGNKQEERE